MPAPGHPIHRRPEEQGRFGISCELAGSRVPLAEELTLSLHQLGQAGAIDLAHDVLLGPGPGV
jgi:hypothetical protein